MQPSGLAVDHNSAARRGEAWPDREAAMLAAVVDLLRVVDADVSGVVELLGLARDVSEWAGAGRRGAQGVVGRLRLPGSLGGVAEAAALLCVLRSVVDDLAAGGGEGGKIGECVAVNLDH